MNSTDITEQQAAARSFHELGTALAAFGRRLNVGSKLIAIGRQFGRISARDLKGDNVLPLRRPVDELRAIVDEIVTLAGELRTLVDAIADAVGVDN